MYTCTVEYGSILSTVLDNREHEDVMICINIICTHVQ